MYVKIPAFEPPLGATTVDGVLVRSEEIQL